MDSFSYACVARSNSISEGEDNFAKDDVQQGKRSGHAVPIGWLIVIFRPRKWSKDCQLANAKILEDGKVILY